MLKILPITLTIIFCSFNFAVSQNLSAPVKLKNTNLKSGFNYGAFTANKHYLAWGEFYTGEISIYNLQTHKLNNLKLRKGRGPHEFIFYTALTLSEDNRLIIGDSENFKLIIYNLNTKKFNKDFKLGKLRPYRLHAIKRFIFALNFGILNNTQYYAVNINKRSEKAINVNKYDLSNEFKYPFKRSGYLTANNWYGIQISRFYPNLYISNLRSKKFFKKIQFDHWNTKRGETTSINGHKAFTPPTDVDVENEDIAFIPGMKYTILILANGESDHRKYKLDQLQVFNIKKEQFMKTLDLGVKGNEITVNNKYLFAYSKHKNAIYQYKIITSSHNTQ